MLNDLIERHRKELKQKIRANDEALGAGKASDWPDYRARVGENRGLKIALETFDETVKRYVRREDTDD